MTRRLPLLIALCLATTVFAGTRLSAQTMATQPATTPTGPPATPPAGASAVLESDARATREQFRELLNRYPPELGRILKMDPTLLRDQAYLSRYPAVAAFLAAHPEIAHNPQFYMQFVQQSFDYTMPTDPRTSAIAMWRNLIEAVSVFVVVAFFGSLFAWLVRTGLEHRRWLRVSRVQTEVHTKLLDRFAGSGDLLSYVQTPAGRRFLEGAPIAVDAPESKPAPAAPINRILWSVQGGVVLVVGGIGFQFVSGRIIEEVAEGLWVLGVLGIAFGVGFILSGAISYLLSRRLGLIDAAPTVPLAGRGDSTAV